LLLSWAPTPAVDDDRTWATLSASSEAGAEARARLGPRFPPRLTFRLALPEAFGAEPLLRLAGGVRDDGRRPPGRRRWCRSRPPRPVTGTAPGWACSP
ncbi:hypothetical protein, partial [Pseudonocardia sp. ICBG601]|uniref:hypothetical protein n=1 Tax=Pseudonocardia sp. ICBG601 TaxID=2846759 RepID=UPI001CF68114